MAPAAKSRVKADLALGSDFVARSRAALATGHIEAHFGRHRASLIASMEAIEYGCKAILHQSGIDYHPTHDKEATLLEAEDSNLGDLARPAAAALRKWLSWDVRSDLRYSDDLRPRDKTLASPKNAADALADADLVADLSARIDAHVRLRKSKKIGVLNGLIGQGAGESRISGWNSTLTPESLVDLLQTKCTQFRDGWTIELVSAHDISSKHALVLNPFGERYPEADVRNLVTYSWIEDFIFAGGTFVNVGGLPFWEAINPRLGLPPHLAIRSIGGPLDVLRDRTPPWQKSLETSRLPNRFGVSVTHAIGFSGGPMNPGESAEPLTVLQHAGLPKDLTMGQKAYRCVVAGEPHVRGVLTIDAPNGPAHVISSISHGTGQLLDIALVVEDTSSINLVAWALDEFVSFRVRELANLESNHERRPGFPTRPAWLS